METFITDQDYGVIVGDAALRTISQASPSVRSAAEAEAAEEVAAYLRSKYDTDAIFAATGAQRSRLIVICVCDIAMYHMSASMPQKMGTEIRKERYDRAIKWLEGVQAGKIMPDLPLATDEDGNPVGFPIIAGSQPQLHHSW